MHVDGKINGKYPIFNDLLAFMWCKLKLCARDVLISTMKQYYKSEDIMKARDVADEEFPAPEENGDRRIKHRKTEDALISVYTLLQNLPTEDPPVFASLNLNNIPYVELKNVDGAALMWQQGQLKDQLQSMSEEQGAIKAQLASIVEHLRSEKANPQPDIAQIPEVPSTDSSYRGAALRANAAKQSTNTTQQPPAPPPAPQRTSAAPVEPQPPAAPPGPKPGGARAREPRGFWRSNERRADSQGRPGGATRGEGARRSDTDTRNERIPRGYREDEDGFLHRIPREPPPMGRKKGTALAAVPFSPRKARIFVSRVRPTTTVDEIREFVRSITGEDAAVQRIVTRNEKYASFLVSVEKQVEDQVLDPDEWEEGLIIRPFRGALRRPLGENTHSAHDDAPTDGAQGGARSRHDTHRRTQDSQGEGGSAAE